VVRGEWGDWARLGPWSSHKEERKGIWYPRPIWPNFNRILKYSKIINQRGEGNGSEMSREVHLIILPSFGIFGIAEVGFLRSSYFLREGQK
jgi:hypothetical protein